MAILSAIPRRVESDIGTLVECDRNYQSEVFVCVSVIGEHVDNLADAVDQLFI